MKEEVKKTRIINNIVKPFFNEEKMEIGVDEVGRGPLFGRVYAAAVILPKDDTFDHSKMKDSKKFHSKKKLIDTAEYIKEKAIAWSVHYEDEKTIDEINILQATQKTMHKCIDSIIKKTYFKKENTLLLIDGNYFKTFTYFNTENKRFEQLEHTCIEGGDNKYSAIAAASILAKVERDKYIEDLCSEYPDLIEKYSLNTNKGYGSKKHIDGIKEHGITMWHRRSFGICSSFV
jgi:ribonuclease HII